jgi:DNA-binding NarL/FixJ family response regulator
MAGIRTVVVTMSPLLTDIIEQSITGHVDLDVVARFGARDFLEKRLPEISPELVLLGLRAGEADEIGRYLLSLVPVARVIAFSGDARHAYLHEMRAHRATLINVSPSELIEAIRPLRSGSGV